MDAAQVFQLEPELEQFVQRGLQPRLAAQDAEALVAGVLNLFKQKDGGDAAAISEIAQMPLQAGFQLSGVNFPQLFTLAEFGG